jgi:hypothetical protein
MKKCFQPCNHACMSPKCKEPFRWMDSCRASFANRSPLSALNAWTRRGGRVLLTSCHACMSMPEMPAHADSPPFVPLSSPFRPPFVPLSSPRRLASLRDKQRSKGEWRNKFRDKFSKRTKTLGPDEQEIWREGS